MGKFICRSAKMSRIITFDLDGTIPSKKNNKQMFRNRKTGKFFPASSNKYKEWHQGASLQISLQKNGIKDVKFPIQKCISLDVTLLYGTKRRADNTNKAESVHDLLVDVGILQDDDWQTTGPTSQIPEYRERQPGAYIVIKIPTV